jgi:hypothetical protein
MRSATASGGLAGGGPAMRWVSAKLGWSLTIL